MFLFIYTHLYLFIIIYNYLFIIWLHLRQRFHHLLWRLKSLPWHTSSTANGDWAEAALWNWVSQYRASRGSPPTSLRKALTSRYIKFRLANACRSEAEKNPRCSLWAKAAVFPPASAASELAMRRCGPNILRCRWPEFRVSAGGEGLDRYFPAITMARQPEEPLFTFAMLFVGGVPFSWLLKLGNTTTSPRRVLLPAPSSVSGKGSFIHRLLQLLRRHFSDFTRPGAGRWPGVRRQQ